MRQNASETVGSIGDELALLDLQQACRYYKNYLNAVQIDIPLSLSCINRLSSVPPRELTDEAQELLQQAIKTAINLDNLDPNFLGVGLACGLTPGVDAIIKVLESTHVEPELFKEIRKVSMKHQGQEVRAVCANVLARHPMAVQYANKLLQLDFFEGKRPSEALDTFRCPKVLLALWQKKLFNHHAGLGNDADAWPLWEQLKERADDPITLCRAAEMLRRAGDIDGAVALYEQAYALDPLQRPYGLRAEALRHPFRPDHTLVDAKRVAISLYSFNKAEVLGETLQSLSGCAIGPARIKILLNGCTDDSLAVAEKAKTLFPQNAVEILTLPVNIGAPAARNWLLAQPATRESDYVAFLDDDISLQPDWLAHMLTVAESDPRIGNVGCKIVFPGEFKLLQYLYRHVSMTHPDAFRISLPAPHQQFDIGLYDVIRETRVVMGCQHLLRVASLDDAPAFDIRYSPSQIDDTDHDLQLCLSGWKVMYCGTVTCVHHQGSGTSMRRKLNMASQGSIIGNDIKFHYKWFDRMPELAHLDCLNLNA